MSRDASVVSEKEIQAVHQCRKKLPTMSEQLFFVAASRECYRVRERKILRKRLWFTPLKDATGPILIPAKQGKSLGILQKS